MTESNEEQLVWGYEGCGAMWTFFSSKEAARSKAGENSVTEVTIEKAHKLDNKRRMELGFSKISLNEFKQCIDHSLSCEE